MSRGPCLDCDVIVVGAGAAGVSAARVLTSAGLRVQVLEARQRLGGRVWTEHVADNALDLGAAWIHGGDNPAHPMAQLAAELGLELVHTDWDSVLMCDAQGGALSLDAIDRAEAALTRLLEGVAERDMEHGDPLSLGDALATALSEEGEDQALIRHMLSITSEYECGATVHQLSATCYDCGECLGGQDMLVFVWWAPEDQFWPDDVHHFSCADLVPGAAPPPPLAPPTAFRCIVNLRAVARAPVLMALVGPHCAAEVEGRDDEAVVDQLLRALALLFPGPVPRPRGHRVTRWGRDPCSRGAYSYLPPGVTPGARDALARPTPPVYWAGEACSAAFPSSVHGAHVSGRQAAQQLLQALGEGAQAEAAATAVVEP